MNAPLQASDFQFDEAFGALSIGPSVLNLNVPLGLQCRRLYGYIFTVVTSGVAYSEVVADVQLIKGHSVLHTIPLVTSTSPAADTTLKKSMPCLFSSAPTGGAIVSKDCLPVFIAQPLTGEATAQILFPIELYAEIDRVLIRIKSVVNVTSTRICVACISSLQH